MFQRKDTYTIPYGYRERIAAERTSNLYRGQVEADPECYIAEHCQIVGKVELGYHAIVMEGAILRADSDCIVVGAESNIQENCILHESTGSPIIIGEHTTIGHGAILHGCTIGDNSLVGMGAIVMDGARIGNNAIVAAGALLTEGFEVPDYHMAIGIPAKLRGPLSPERVNEIVLPFTEVNLLEAEAMLAEGLMHHPSPEVLRKVGALA